MALSPPLVNDPQANLGFLREDARLAIIVISNEDDQSALPLDYYEQAFASLKPGRRHMMSISSYTAPHPMPQSCWVGNSQSGSAYHYISLVTHGIDEFLCNPTWSTSLGNLAMHAVAPHHTFELSRQGDNESLVVKVDGEEVSRTLAGGCFNCISGWTYSPQENEVCFCRDSRPDAGSSVQISYQGACD